MVRLWLNFLLDTFQLRFGGLQFTGQDELSRFNPQLHLAFMQHVFPNPKDQKEKSIEAKT